MTAPRPWTDRLARGEGRRERMAMSWSNDTFETQSGAGRDFRTLRALGPYLWPAARVDLKVRVVVAVALLVTSCAGPGESLPIRHSKLVQTAI